MSTRSVCRLRRLRSTPFPVNFQIGDYATSNRCRHFGALGVSGGRAMVSVILFGSAAIGGWVEAVSDVDLILVVPDCATDEDMDRLRSEVERIEILHRLRSHSAMANQRLEKFLDRLTAHDRTFFICTRGDLLSGNIGRILRIHPSQAIFVDRIVLANFVASGIT